MAPKIKVTYFNLRGRAEPVRLLLAYGGLQYEDCRITPGFEDPKPWMAMKGLTPYGGLPLLEWNGELLAQSLAITRFVAREVGLGGRNSLECAQADEVVDALNDLFEAGAKAFFSKDEALMKKHATETLPNGLDKLEKRLTGRGGQFFAGNALTWADVMACNFLNNLPDQSCMAKFPKMKNLVDRVACIPNIKTWVEKRPVTKL